MNEFEQVFDHYPMLLLRCCCT